MHCGVGDAASTSVKVEHHIRDSAYGAVEHTDNAVGGSDYIVAEETDILAFDPLSEVSIGIRF